MSVRSSLLSSQFASASHSGQRADRILSDTLQRQRDFTSAGTLRQHGLPRPIAYSMVVAA